MPPIRRQGQRDGPADPLRRAGNERDPFLTRRLPRTAHPTSRAIPEPLTHCASFLTQVFLTAYPQKSMRRHVKVVAIL
jgi:hypothetical protein